MVRSKSDSTSLVGAMRLLGEPLRLRILALLADHELSVGELTRSLGVSQSRVSNHLRLLRDAQLLSSRHAGTTTFLRLARLNGAQAVAGRLWGSLASELQAIPERSADEVRLERVLADRLEKEGALFDRMAEDWDELAGAFSTGQARLRAGQHLIPRNLRVADLGCGTAYTSSPLLGLCGHLILVDPSQGMLDQAKKRLTRQRPSTGLEFRQGSFDRLPLDDDEVDGAIASMVFHHLEDWQGGLAEMVRVVRPGGTCVVLELAPHSEAWMRQDLGDRHLGLEAADLVKAFERAGLTDVLLDPVDDRYCPRRPDQNPDDASPSLSLFVVRGQVPDPKPTTST